MLNVVLFLLLIGVLTTSHEFGHYIVARRCGIVVKEFAVGMGPVLLSWTKHETKYSLRAIPLGGFCMFLDDPTDGADKLVEQETDEPVPGSFRGASVGRRAAVAAAGPLFNFILAYILAVFVVGMTYTDIPVVKEIEPNSPVMEAGIEAGDTITSINGSRIHLSREIMLYSMTGGRAPVTIGYERNGEHREVTIQPRFDEKSGRYLMGFNDYAEYIRCNFIQSLKYGFYEVKFGLDSTLKGLAMIVKGQAGRKDISGPIGVAKIVGSVAESASAYGIMAVVLSLSNIAMLLSVNLGVMNLLPIPALDGGRLFLMLIEAVRGKPLSPDREFAVQLVGVAMVIALTVFAFYNDLTNIFM